MPRGRARLAAAAASEEEAASSDFGDFSDERSAALGQPTKAVAAAADGSPRTAGGRTMEAELTGEVTVEEDVEEGGELTGWALARALFAASIGNFLEWLDFALFGMFADQIGATFFPPAGATQQLIEAFLVYGSAFLMRPLGGV